MEQITIHIPVFSVSTLDRPDPIIITEAMLDNHDCREDGCEVCLKHIWGGQYGN